MTAELAPAPAADRTSRPWGTGRRPLLVLCVVAAVFAGGVHQLAFADGTLNNDEVAYLLQAEAITRGDLFLEAPELPEAHQPWFFVARDPGFVSKYLPLVSAVLAVGLATTDSVAPVLALLAAAVPWLVEALAREVGFDRRRALVAAALVSLSPVVLLESALPLSYLLFLVLVTGSWLLVLRLGHGRSGAAAAVSLGLAGTAAACARPYDAVLLLVPGLVWAARRRGPDWWRLAGWLVLGALPLTVAVAAYNTVATGRPWTLPFGLLEASDTVGFGVRRLFPEQNANHFGPLQGLAGLGLHFVAGLLVWTALGPLLLPAAVGAWRTAPPATRMLLASAGLHLVGYALFWGPWNFSWIWRTGVRVLGPIYAMPLVVPVVLAGLPVLERWYRARPRRGRRLAALAALLSLGVVVFGLQQAAVDAGRTDRVLAAAERARTRGPLLIDVDPPYLGYPVSGLVNDAALAAATPVPPVVAEPAPQLLQLPKPVYGFNALTYAVTTQDRVEAPEVFLDVTRGGTRDRDVLVVERAGRTAACRLGDAGALRLDSSGVRGCEGVPVPRKWTKEVHRRCSDRSCLALAVYRVSDSRRERRLAWRLLPVETRDGSVALLVDGETVESTGRGWLRVARTWAPSDLSRGRPPLGRPGGRALL